MDGGFGYGTGASSRIKLFEGSKERIKARGENEWVQNAV